MRIPIPCIGRTYTISFRFYRLRADHHAPRGRVGDHMPCFLFFNSQQLCTEHARTALAPPPPFPQAQRERRRGPRAAAAARSARRRGTTRDITSHLPPIIGRRTRRRVQHRARAWGPALSCVAVGRPVGPWGGLITWATLLGLIDDGEPRCLTQCSRSAYIRALPRARRALCTLALVYL